MTIEPMKLLVDREQLRGVLEEIPKRSKFIGPSAEKPIGVVLHNTYHPNLALATDYIAGTNKTGKNVRKAGGLYHFNEGQLIDNWWVRYKQLGWYSGPHFFIFEKGIYIATPPEHRGTHSPSFNRNRYGIEMLGDYEKEVLPDSIKSHTVVCIQELLRYLGVVANETTVKFHFEDPRTTHPCPGKNVRDKKMWIKEVNKELLK